MPFQSPVFKNSKPNTCSDRIHNVNSVGVSNEKNAVAEYGIRNQTVDIQNENNPAASLVNVAAIPLEEARQPQENIIEKKTGNKNVDQIGKQTKHIETKTVKRTVNGAKVKKVTPKKTAKPAKEDANGKISILQAANKLKESKTMVRKKSGVVTFEQRDPSLTSNHSSQNTVSQKSYKLALSQPPSTLNHRQRLTWLQERRDVGLWVECNHQHCRKWRYLPRVHDPTTLPDLWYCHMNPEKPLTVAEEQDVIYSRYNAGSVVWARQLGYPWWPAMVDDCPDTEVYYWLDGFSDIPTHFNVVFFDSNDVTRSWLTPQQLRPFQPTKVLVNNDKYRDRILAAKDQAEQAIKLGITERLKKYSFISRFSGPIISPKVATSTKRKYSETSASEDDNEYVELVVSDAAPVPSKEEPISQTKSQDRYGGRMFPNKRLENSPSDMGERAFTCGDSFDSRVTPDSTVSKISDRAVMGDSHQSTLPCSAAKNEGTDHGARSLAVMEEAELMGTADTGSTWQPREPYGCTTTKTISRGTGSSAGDSDGSANSDSDDFEF